MPMWCSAIERGSGRHSGTSSTTPFATATERSPYAATGSRTLSPSTCRTRVQASLLMSSIAPSIASPAVRTHAPEPVPGSVLPSCAPRARQHGISRVPADQPMWPTSPGPQVSLNRTSRRSAPAGLGQPRQHVGAGVGAKMPGDGRGRRPGRVQQRQARMASGGLQAHREVGRGDVGCSCRREQRPARPAAQQPTSVLGHPEDADHCQRPARAPPRLTNSDGWLWRCEATADVGEFGSHLLVRTINHVCEKRPHWWPCQMLGVGEHPNRVWPTIASYARTMDYLDIAGIARRPGPRSSLVCARRPYQGSGGRRIQAGSSQPAPGTP
jgi:hypothetical protein